MKRICVFCGSQQGKTEIYKDAAAALARVMARENIDLVFGGGGIGLMGVVANEILKTGGRAIGVIPRFLSDRELGHNGLSELIMVESMHQRKQKMAELADGFIAMPGGFGTLEELCEILTWRQLNLVDKPVGILNVHGFFDRLIGLFDTMINEGFLSHWHKELFFVEVDPALLIEKFVRFSPPHKQDIEKT